jgi:dihydrofolate reductase
LKNQTVQVSIIVAVAENGVIGRGGKLPWHLAGDLKRFKSLTMGRTIIMGRKTWESIARPLVGRRMIVISGQPDYRTGHESVHLSNSLADALRFAQSTNDDEAFVIGGAELYREALERADRMYWTRVQAQVTGDTRFPNVDWSEWKLLESEAHDADADNDHPFTFELYERAGSN